MKKIISLLVVLVVVIAMVGCKKDDGKTHIKYFTFSAAPDHIEDLKKMIEEFENENPDIEVEYETAAFNDYFTKLQTLIAGGDAPDVFELNYENFIFYAEKNTLLDLNPYIEADEFDTSVYNQEALQAFEYDSKQYGLVESFSNVVFFYNKDLFDQAGIDYPTADWTWEDELAAAQAISALGDDIYGTFSPIQFWEFYKTIAQNGGSIFNADKTEVTINSAANVEALQWMVDKVNRYNVTPSDAEMSGQSPEDLFKAGKIGMLRTGIWMFSGFENITFNWDIQLEPGNTQKAHHFFANGIAVSKDTKHKEASWKFAQFVTSNNKATQVRIDSSWELPAVTDETVLNGYLEKSIPASREVVFDALDTLVVPPVITDWNKLTDVVGKELEAAKLGTKTPQEALDAAKIEVEKLIK